MNRKKRIGIFGGGNILDAHAPGLVGMKESVEILAVAEPDTKQVGRIKKLLGEEVQIYSSYEQLLQNAEIDAVDILLPHHLHLPATIAAAKKGLHILVEKVMARNIQECDQMIAACEENNVSLTICHDRRYSSEWMALKQIVDSNVLGEIFSWKLDHNQNVSLPAGHWVRSKEMIGGGAIMSCLTHQIDGLRWLGGEVEMVASMTQTDTNRMQGEFSGAILAKMKSKAMAELSINWWTDSHKSEMNGLWYERVQVCGKNGEAYYVNGKGTFVHLHEDKDQAGAKLFGENILKEFVRVEVGNWSGHTYCINEWFKSILGLPSNIITRGTDCRGTVEVAEAAYLSEATQRFVTLPLLSNKFKNNFIKGKTSCQL